MKFCKAGELFIVHLLEHNAMLSNMQIHVILGSCSGAGEVMKFSFF